MRTVCVGVWLTSLRSPLSGCAGPWTSRATIGCRRPRCVRAVRPETNFYSHRNWAVARCHIRPIGPSPPRVSAPSTVTAVVAGPPCLGSGALRRGYGCSCGCHDRSCVLTPRLLAAASRLLQPCAGRQFIAFQVMPERNQQFSRHRYDTHLAGPLPTAGKALAKPLTQRALRLVAQP